MNFRTILHYLLGRIVVGLVAVMVKINPPMTMVKSYYWNGENEFKPYNHLMWDNTLYYQLGKEWISYSESIQEGMKMFDELKKE